MGGQHDRSRQNGTAIVSYEEEKMGRQQRTRPFQENPTNEQVKERLRQIEQQKKRNKASTEKEKEKPKKNLV